jgi:hypothetical protein
MFIISAYNEHVNLVNNPMTFDNPYAPPECEVATTAEWDWPEEGIYVDGQCLVIKPGAAWPAKCVRTCAPASEMCRVQLYCIGANDGSHPQPPPYKLFPFNAGFEITVPVSSAWLQKHVRATLIARSCLSLGFLCLGITLLTSLIALLNGRSPAEYIGTWVVMPIFALSLVLLAIGSVLQEVWKPLRQIERIEHGYMWLSGAHVDYLSQLPAWPQPRSFWRRFFLG